MASESTIRRALRDVDASELDAALCAWVAARCQPPGHGPRVIAIDGKSARGARGPGGRPVHLLAAFEVTNGTVLGQSPWMGRATRSTRFARCSRELTSPGR